MNNCTICNKPIRLGPTSAERASKDVTGKSAAYYTSLFRTHATCELEKRSRDTAELMRRRNEAYQKSIVSWPLRPQTA